MRLSQYPINTMKETPAEAEVVSHQLMLRAGLILRVGTGLYSWLPLGLRVLRKVERIIREEMDRAGALELVMPVVQPAELWQESGRWSEYGPELLRIKDRHDRDFVAGPTHEEVITDIARRELKSYRQLPVNFYQIQTTGEDAIVFSDGDDYAANLEAAVALPPAETRPAPRAPLHKVATPGTRTIADVARLLEVHPTQTIKTLIVAGSDDTVVALVLRGDHDLNAIKAQKLPGVSSPLRLASAEQVRAASGTDPGYVGPVGLKAQVYADHAALVLADFVCGANEKDMHLTGVNWERDLVAPTAADLRNVVDGDPSPSGNGKLRIARGIEVGHIFQLGRKYSEPMRAIVLDESGKETPLLMGCYGIGVTRLVAAAIEQNHDDHGIIWPIPIAPFQVVLVPLNLQRSDRVRELTERLYTDFTAAGIEVLYDDRDARPGVKFSDAELLGIPHRLVIADRGLDAGTLEYRGRRDAESTQFPLAEALVFIRAKLAG